MKARLCRFFLHNEGLGQRHDQLDLVFFLLSSTTHIILMLQIEYLSRPGSVFSHHFGVQVNRPSCITTILFPLFSFLFLSNLLNDPSFLSHSLHIPFRMRIIHPIIVLLSYVRLFFVPTVSLVSYFLYCLQILCSLVLFSIPVCCFDISSSEPYSFLPPLCTTTSIFLSHTGSRCRFSFSESLDSSHFHPIHLSHSLLLFRIFWCLSS